MKSFYRFLAIAFLGLNLSSIVHDLPQVRAQSPVSVLVLMQTGKENYDAGKFATAAEVLEQAAVVLQAENDRLKEAQALSLLSLARQKLGEWQKAREELDRSLSLLEKEQFDSQEFYRVKAQVFNARGHLELATGNPEAALESWQEAEKNYLKVKANEAAIGSRINQAQAMQSLGLYRRSQKLLEQIEPEFQALPDSHLKLEGLLNLGNLLQVVGETQRSQEILEQSLALADKLSSPQDLSQVLLSLGNTQWSLGKRAETAKETTTAQDYFLKALNYYRSAETKANSDLVKIQALLNQLNLLVENPKLTPIQGLTSKIDEKIGTIPASRESIYARVNFARSLMKMQNEEWRQERTEKLSVNNILETAIEEAQSLEDKRAESYALGTLGAFFERKGDRSQAKAFTESALLIAQSIQASDLAYQWQWQIGRLKKQEGAITSALEAYTEAVKNLSSLRGDLVALNPDLQFSFREQVEPVYRELVELLLRSEPTQEDLELARDTLEDLQLAELNNFFREACLDTKP